MTYSCSSQKSGILTIDFKGKDTCIFLKDETGKPISIDRKLIISENTVSDTIAIGFSVVYPKTPDKMIYIKLDDRTDMAIYDEAYPDLPKTDRIWIHLYENRFCTGTLKIKYSY